mmetsp:Transcript_44408/g.102610  ORF Transcript_44408/g.102610 Transcript_44408/m.102610 type:complete len:585 (+) Transcript_44408:73-1827(+)
MQSDLRGFENDRLRASIADSKFAQDVLGQIDTKGYAVLPGIFTHTEADAEYERMWSWIEKVSPAVRRFEPESWRGDGEVDPWPCSQRDMMQLHQAGWVFGDLRERMAERVFEKLYGTRELHSSKDGFTLQRPTFGELNRSPNDHYDQGVHMSGLQCIQGSVALTDQEPGSGCFLCWPGSHVHHGTIMTKRGQKKGRKDFVILTEQEKDYLQEQGIQPVRVPVGRGDVVLWRSDVAHKGAPPIGRHDTFRGVVYICMLPAALTPQDVYTQKRRAYEQLETGSHWPCREEWFVPGREPRFTLRPFFNKPPELSPRLRLLYGLEHYGSPPQPLAPMEPAVAPGGTVIVKRVARRSAAERGSAKWTNPAKPAAEVIRVERDGVVGDYNHYRTMAKSSTPDRAVSLVSLEALDSLRFDGYEVGHGDLGENLTLQVPEASLAAGVRLHAIQPGGLELELTELIVPCRNLEHLPALAALPERQLRSFARACRGRRGWYARVLVSGELRAGNILVLVAAENAAGAEVLQEAHDLVAGSNQEASSMTPQHTQVGRRRGAGAGDGRVRRWRRTVMGAEASGANAGAVASEATAN